MNITGLEESGDKYVIPSVRNLLIYWSFLYHKANKGGEHELVPEECEDGWALNRWFF